MSKRAFKRAGAELEQVGQALAALPDTDATASEARRLAELAGEFCLFGLDIALSDTAWNVPADEAYRVSEEVEPEAANDVAEEALVEPQPDPTPAQAPSFAFPLLPRRGIHLDSTLPVRLMQALDWLFVLVVAELAALWGAGIGLLDLSLGAATAFIACALSLKAGLWLTDSYRVSPGRMRADRSVGGLALGTILGLILSAAIAPDARGAAALSAALPVAAIILAGVHAALAVWSRAAHRRGVFSETIVLVGATDAAQRIADRIAKTGESRIVAVVEDRLSRSPTQVGATPVGGNIDDLLNWDGLPNVDRIVITVTQKAEGRVRDIIERLRVIPNRVDLLLDYETFNVRGKGAQRFAGAAVACVSGRPHNHRRAMLKRAQDVIIGTGLLVLFAIPMLVIALAIKLDSKGPVLYRQRRHGFNNRVITMLKFRSMKHDPDAPLQQVKANDQRVTRVGKLLRSKSLDELPQLINVLRGDMSLVGPRPHAIGMKAAERDLAHIVAEYAHRHRVKPGITGWAQINGSRGPVETCAAVRKRVRYDLDYVARASLAFDLQILFRTIPALLGDKKVTR